MIHKERHFTPEQLALIQEICDVMKPFGPKLATLDISLVMVAAHNGHRCDAPVIATQSNLTDAGEADILAMALWKRTHDALHRDIVERQVIDAVDKLLEDAVAGAAMRHPKGSA